jgi:alpha-tubulin suppressor-like RCC1 family protein
VLDSNVVSGSVTEKLIKYVLEGGQNYCNGFLDTDGFLYMVGLGSNGQLGQGDTTNHTTLVKVKGVGGSGFLENIVDICLGNQHTVACDSSGNCYAWGYNNSGQLGQGDTTSRNTPVKVKGVGGSGFLTNIIKVSASMDVSYAVDSSGNCYAWGNGTNGRLGQGDTTSHDTPVQVKGVGGTGYLANIIQISSGANGYNVLALTSSGTVYAWGSNHAGGLGDGTTTDRNTPVQVKGVGGTGYLTGITKLAQHGYNYSGCSMVLGSNGKAYTWGGNQFGELGQNNTSNTNTPVIVKGVGGSGYLENVVDVACGGYHMHACDSDGTCYGWGRNHSSSPIGDGTSSQRNTPVKVKGVGGSGYLENIIGVGSSRFGGYAVDNEGNVYGWDQNGNGQLGDGTSTTRSSPVQVKGVGGSGFLSLFDKAPPSLTFDGFNKYTFIGADTGSTYKLKYFSNTYDLGTTSTAYIANPGTYSAEIKGATNFALSSNVSGTVSEPTISGPVSIEWASLNYSNFDGSGGKAAIGTTGGTLVLDGTWNTSATSPYVGTAIDITGASAADHNFKYTIPFKPKSQSFELSFKATGSSGTTFQVYLGYLTLNWSMAQGWNSSGDSRQKVLNLYAPAGSSIYLAGITGQSMDQSSYTYDSTKPFVITSDTSTLKIEHNGNSKSIDLTATHEDSSGGTVADPEYYLWMAFDENSSNALYNLSDVTYSVGGEVIKAFPTLGFDGYNKLSFSNIAPTTSNVTFDGKTYSIGSATNIYIENTGTYEAESKGTTTFALVKKQVTGTIGPNTTPVFTPVQLDADPVTDPQPSGNRSFRWQSTTGTKHYYRGYNGNTIDAGPMLIYYDTSDKKWYDGDTADHPNSFVVTTTQAVPSLSGATDPSSATGTSNAEYIHCCRINGTHLFSFKMAGWVTPTNPSLTFDGYKLVVSGITPTSTTLKYGSNTYEIGSATNIYVKDTGAYTAEIGGAADFALTSNTVSGTLKTIEPGFASRYQGSMALTYDGKLYAWGMNSEGEAGVGTSSDITVPTLCTGITQGTVAKLLSSSELTDNSRGEVSAIKTTDGKIYMAGKGDNFAYLVRRPIRRVLQT